MRMLEVILFLVILTTTGGILFVKPNRRLDIVFFDVRGASYVTTWNY